MIFNKKIIQKAIETAERKGVTQATGELLKDLGVKSISVKGTIPASGPLLIISNHNSVFDTLILHSLIERNDYHFIALSTYKIFGSKIVEKLLPIYRVRSLSHHVFEYPLSLQMNGAAPENLPLSEIKIRNRKTISDGANLINHGKAVSIFPTGSGGKSMKDSTWKAGIGFLVKQIKNPQTQVMFVKIIGTRRTDLVAYLHPFFSTLLFRPKPITVYFSRPMLLRKLVNIGDEAKSIAKKLEDHYKLVSVYDFILQI